MSAFICMSRRLMGTAWPMKTSTAYTGLRSFSAGTEAVGAASASSSSSAVPPFANLGGGGGGGRAAILQRLPPNLKLDYATIQYLRKEEGIAQATQALAQLGPPVLRLPVMDLLTAKPTGAEVELDKRVFTQEIRRDIVHRVVVWQEKNARTTLYKAKARGEVRGGGRKPWKQKGLGKARQASIRSPLWEGGGVAHPPKLREWDIKLQRKVRRLGMRIVLAAKFQDRRLSIVNTLEMSSIRGGSSTTTTAAEADASSSPAVALDGSSNNSSSSTTIPAGGGKTKAVIGILKAHGFVKEGNATTTQERVLFVHDETDVDDDFVRAVANLGKDARVTPQIGASVTDIVRAERLVITARALATLTHRVTRDM